MSEKRKRVVLTITQKLEVLKKLEDGETLTNLSAEYGVSTNTIRDMSKNKESLYEYVAKVDNDCTLERKTMKKPKYEIIDVALIDWLNKKRVAGKSVTDIMCCEKAEYFHCVFNFEEPFKANISWLNRFKHRYGISDIEESPKPRQKKCKPLGILEKRKRVVLTIKQKIELLKRLDDGELLTSLSAEYGVSTNTIRDMRHNKANLYEYITKVDSDGPLNRKTMKKPKFELIDEALIDWFSQQRTANEIVTGPMCCEKAVFFHKAYNIEEPFRPSNSWLDRFKQRYGIREVKTSNGKTLDFLVCTDNRDLISSEKVDVNKMISDDEPTKTTVEISADTILFESQIKKENVDNDPLMLDENKHISNENIGNDEAFNAIDILLKYMQQRKFNMEDITYLKNIHDKIKETK